MDVVPSKILIIDDNEDNCNIVSRLLERDGYVTRQASSFDPAMALMAKEQFDLVLLDIMMPGTDGIEILQVMRGDVSLQDIPVIMISAYSDKKNVLTCLELGANDFITKPIEAKIVRAKVWKCLNSLTELKDVV